MNGNIISQLLHHIQKLLAKVLQMNELDSSFGYALI